MAAEDEGVGDAWGVPGVGQSLEIGWITGQWATLTEISPQYIVTLETSTPVDC